MSLGTAGLSQMDRRTLPGRHSAGLCVALIPLVMPKDPQKNTNVQKTKADKAADRAYDKQHAKSLERRGVQTPKPTHKRGKGK